MLEIDCGAAAGGSMCRSELPCSGLSSINGSPGRIPSRINCEASEARMTPARRAITFDPPAGCRKKKLREPLNAIFSIPKSFAAEPVRTLVAGRPEEVGARDNGAGDDLLMRPSATMAGSSSKEKGETYQETQDEQTHANSIAKKRDGCTALAHVRPQLSDDRMDQLRTDRRMR
ncbi:hypothetical protein [Bradyrhizobium sp. USDA 4452]